MLSRLNIKNIALIPSLELSFGEGLVILSGETGAGKTIIIDSLNFVLGERADKALIRHGEVFASVEAEFSVCSSAVLAKLNEIGISTGDKNLTIFRKMSVDGKNECRLNGKNVNLQTLKSITALLADIHGQHEHQSLLKTETHIELLDKFAERELKDFIENYKKQHLAFKNLDAALKKYGSPEERSRRAENLAFEIEEINSAELTPDLENEIINKRTIYANSEKLVSAVSGAYNLLLGGEDGADALMIIRNALVCLRAAQNIDDSILPLVERLEGSEIEIKDIADNIKNLAESYEFDPNKAERAEEQYEKLKLLRKKYGESVEKILDYRDKITEEYEFLESLAADTEKLITEREVLRLKMFDAGITLSEKRREAAAKFEQAILKKLSELGMGNSSFIVDFDELPATTDDAVFVENGIDTVEFLISANVGEPPKPLARIISGGEMSRFMLAVKAITAKIDGIGMLVFDEIDAGISGKIAVAVAIKMHKIARNTQVIAVTHLPQLAAIADSNYLICKDNDGIKTQTKVKKLDFEGKLAEVARLSGGLGGEHALAHAQELIENIKSL